MTTPGPDPDFALTPSGNLRRRVLVSRLMEGGATASAVLAVGVLGIVLFTVVDRGGSQLSWSFVTKNPPALFGATGGGIANAIIGTIIIVALAAAIATPVGVLTALYLTEFAGPRTTRVLQLALDLMNGLPSIVIGLVVFGLLVAGHGHSGFAGSVGLSVVMLPLIARSSVEVLRRVPGNLREAADALGVSRWRTVLGVVLPTALGGIVTGTILSVARAAGETAPLLVCNSIGLDPSKTQLNPFGHPVPNIPVLIFQLSENGDPSALPQAWGAAFVLLAFILAANIGARALLARSKAARLTR
jgi:phosphate transport system permease protein